MKTLNKALLLSLLVSVNSYATLKESLQDSTVFFTVGTGYKFQETIQRYTSKRGVVTEGNNPYSARFEIGINTPIDKSISVQWGLSHDSQWSTGAPFNDKGEYYKSEFYLDVTYTFSIKELIK